MKNIVFEYRQFTQSIDNGGNTSGFSAEIEKKNKQKHHIAFESNSK